MNGNCKPGARLDAQIQVLLRLSLLFQAPLAFRHLTLASCGAIELDKIKMKCHSKRPKKLIFMGTLFF